MRKSELKEYLRVNHELHPHTEEEIIGVSDVIDLIEQLEEPEKPIIPQFMADYVDKNKNVGRGQFIFNTIVNSNLFEQGEVSENAIPANVSRYIQYENVETFIKAVYGYEVERAPKYLVKVNKQDSWLYLKSMSLYKDVEQLTDLNSNLEGWKEEAIKFSNKEQAESIAKFFGGKIEEVVE